MYDEVRAEAESYVGLEVLKCFGRKAFRGVVESIIPPEPGDPDDDGSYWWKVKYEDGDEVGAGPQDAASFACLPYFRCLLERHLEQEDLSFSELKGILMEVNNVASKEVSSARSAP